MVQVVFFLRLDRFQVGLDDYFSYATVDQTQSIRCPVTQVDDPAFYIRTAIIDPDDHRMAIGQISHPRIGR